MAYGAFYSFYYGGTVGNELGMSDPVFMKKYGKELEMDSGKWIDSSVWHGKAHTWEKMKWLIAEVGSRLVSHMHETVFADGCTMRIVEAHFRRKAVPVEGNSERCGCAERS